MSVCLWNKSTKLKELTPTFLQKNYKSSPEDSKILRALSVLCAANPPMHAHLFADGIPTICRPASFLKSVRQDWIKPIWRKHLRSKPISFSHEKEALLPVDSKAFLMWSLQQVDTILQLNTMQHLLRGHWWKLAFPQLS